MTSTTDPKKILAEAKARKAVAEAEQAEYHAQMTRLSLDAEERSERNPLASNFNNRVYHFNGPVNGPKVEHAISTLTVWHRLFPGEDFKIVFHSPGGSVFDGMALFDHVTYLRGQGHKITTIAQGYAASMGGILLQAGDVRAMGKESYVLIHEISTVAIGKASELEDEVAFLKKMGERVIKIFVGRSGGKLTEAQFKKMWKKTDCWLDSDDCLRLGIVDEVV